MDKVRIQIVNYKTKAWLQECLISLAQDLKDFSDSFSVVILDNASGDDLSDIPEKFVELQAEVFKSDKNIGFGAGHNLLAKHGEAEFILLLNPDVKFIESKTTQRLIQSAVDNRADVVGPRLQTGHGFTQRWDHGELDGWRAWIALNSGNSYWKERMSPGFVVWVSGAVFLIKKTAFDNLGGFDEYFFLYKEEEELCWRLRASGGKILYDPNIAVFHYSGAVAKKSDHMQKSVSYFLDKHFRVRPGYHFFKALNKLIH